MLRESITTSNMCQEGEREQVTVPFQSEGKRTTRTKRGRQVSITRQGIVIQVNQSAGNHVYG